MHDPFDLVGDVLDGQFRIDEVVGEGAMTIVYRATNVGVAASVAVKCLNLPATLDIALAQPLIDTFQDGCKLHYKLARGSLAIAQVIASGTTLAPRTGATVPFLVREWFEGESLSMNLSRRRAEGEQGRTLEDAVRLLQPAAEGLAYAHTQNVPHLSVNPTNFFLASVGPKTTLKVLDFGVGKLADDASDKKQDGVGLHLLFPAYAAPEQLLRTVGPIGPWTDVYAFTLVFLEVLSDRVVMAEKDPGAIAQRTLHSTLRVSPKVHGIELPADVEALFSSALALDPKKRPTSMGDLWQRLLRMIPRAVWVVTSSVPPPSNRKRTGPLLRRVRRSRRSRLLGIALRKSKHFKATEHIRDTQPAPRPSMRIPRPSGRPPASSHAPSVRPEARSSRIPPPLPRRRVDVLPPPLPASALAAPRVPTIDFEPEPHEVISIPPSAETKSAEVPSVPPPPAELLAVEASLFPSPPQDDPKPDPLPVLASPLPPPSPTPPPDPTPTPEVIYQQPAQPHTEPPAHNVLIRRRATIIVLAVVGIGALVLLIAIIKSFSHSTEPVASASHSTPKAPPTVSTSPPIAIVVPPVVYASTTTPSAPAPARFDKRTAIKALDDVGKDLTPCKRKTQKGVWGIGNAGVQFRNDGTVVKVTMGAPFRGTVEGQCVIDTLARAQIPPYTGIVGMIYYTFILPP